MQWEQTEKMNQKGRQEKLKTKQTPLKNSLSRLEEIAKEKIKLKSELEKTKTDKDKENINALFNELLYEEKEIQEEMKAGKDKKK